MLGDWLSNLLSLVALALLLLLVRPLSAEPARGASAAPAPTSTTAPPPPATPEAPSDVPALTDRREPTPGLLLGRLEHAGISWQIARVDLRAARLELAGQDPTWRGPRSIERLQAALTDAGQRLLWATNAGMFHFGGRPVGLHVEGGHVRAALETQDGFGNFYMRPNGALLVGDDGARIRETSEVAAAPGTPRVASQSGPLLLRSGRMHPAVRPGFGRRVSRSGVGAAGPDVLWFALSDGGASFHDIATLFRDVLACPDALYLDGSISAWFEGPERSSPPSDEAFSGLFYVSAPR